MAKKSKLNTKANRLFDKQVKESLERQRTRFTQPPTQKVSSVQAEPTLNRVGSPTDPKTGGSENRSKSGGKSNKVSKPNLNPRTPGKPAFGKEHVPRTKTGPKINRFKTGVGAAFAFGVGAEAFDLGSGDYATQQDAFDQLGFLAPQSSRADFNPIGRAVDDTASFVTGGRAEPNILGRAGNAIKRVFTGDPKAEIESQFGAERSLMLRALAKKRATETGENLDTVLVNLTRRADLLSNRLENDPGFDVNSLTGEDADLAISLGAKIDPQKARTALPPKQDVLELPILDNGASELNDPDVATDPFSNIDAQPGQAKAVFDKVINGQSISPSEVGIATQLRTSGIIQGEFNVFQDEGDLSSGTPATPTTPAATTAPSKPSLERGPTSIFKRVGEDGIVEFSQEGGEGFEEVDLGISNNLQDGFLVSQDNIQQFPGTSAFVEGISKDVRTREVDFKRQQHRARSNQHRLFRRARSNVLNANPHLKRLLRSGSKNEKGAAGAAINKYTLEAMRIMQQGRDAFKAEDFDTTDQVLEADRNDIQAFGVEANLERTRAFEEANKISAFKAISDSNRKGLSFQRDLRNDSDDTVESFFTENYRPDEDGVFPDERGSTFNTFQSIRPDNFSNLKKSDQQKVLQRSAFISNIQDIIRDQSLSIDPNLFTQDFNIMNHQILTNKIPGIVITGNRGLLETVRNLKEAISAQFSNNQLRTNFIRIGKKQLTLGQYLNLGKGQGFNEPQTISLINRVTKK